MAKVDYDVGDLIYAIAGSSKYPIRQGQVFTCVDVRPDIVTKKGKSPVFLAELKCFDGKGGAFNAFMFRKLPKKSQEFFTGEMQENRDLVPAQ